MSWVVAIAVILLVWWVAKRQLRARQQNSADKPDVLAGLRTEERAYTQGAGWGTVGATVGSVIGIAAFGGAISGIIPGAVIGWVIGFLAAKAARGNSQPLQQEPPAEAESVPPPQQYQQQSEKQDRSGISDWVVLIIGAIIAWPWLTHNDSPPLNAAVQPAPHVSAPAPKPTETISAPAKKIKQSRRTQNAADVAPRQPCEIKPVMTDEERLACGAR